MEDTYKIKVASEPEGTFKEFCINEEFKKRAWDCNHEKELPAVTAADNGKVLGVSSGAWGAVQPSGSSPLIVTLTETEEEGIYIPSSSLAEIYAAHQQSRNVYISTDENSLLLINTFFPEYSYCLASAILLIDEGLQCEAVQYMLMNSGEEPVETYCIKSTVELQIAT